MLKRTITGFFIAVVTITFFLLRLFVDYRLFDILTYAMAILGTYEMATALGGRLTPLRKTAVTLFPVIVMPFVTFAKKYALLVALLYAAIVFSLCIFDKAAEKATNYKVEKTVNDPNKEATQVNSQENALNGIGLVMLTLFYPTVPLICLQLANSSLNDLSFMAITSIFLIAQLTDVFAYFVGSLIKGKKLIPEISPNKTVSGAIGGIIGGIIGSAAAYFISTWANQTPFIGSSAVTVVLFIILTGAVLSVVNQVGDLAESYIKRKIGIKDMGNIFPGHGGMLDRIDGLSLVSLVTFVLYSFLI